MYVMSINQILFSFKKSPTKIEELTAGADEKNTAQPRRENLIRNDLDKSEFMKSQCQVSLSFYMCHTAFTSFADSGFCIEAALKLKPHLNRGRTKKLKIAH